MLELLDIRREHIEVTKSFLLRAALAIDSMTLHGEEMMFIKYSI